MFLDEVAATGKCKAKTSRIDRAATAGNEKLVVSCVAVARTIERVGSFCERVYGGLISE